MDDLAMAISAVFASAGRPGARVRAWREADSVRAEISALEPLDDPLAGREWPPPAQGATRGLWLANQLCDLVELRSTAASTVVRLHLAAPVAAV